jgi:hypothetical protein
MASVSDKILFLALNGVKFRERSCCTVVEGYDIEGKGSFRYFVSTFLKASEDSCLSLGLFSCGGGFIGEIGV